MRNIFDALALPVRQMTVHNCCLFSVESDAHGWERMTVEIEGVQGHVTGSSKYSELSNGGRIGQWGYLQTVDGFANNELPNGATRFVAYIDQSLRRFPAIDRHGLLGWTCEFSGVYEFVAPANIIPGKDGDFIKDETEEITLQIPPEFIRLAKLTQMSPEDLLRSFIADVTGIHNYLSCPRADEYNSNGSDEQDLAEEWLRRAYGFNMISEGELAKREEEIELFENSRDELTAILDEWIVDGHDPDELLDAVRKIEESKKKESD